MATKRKTKKRAKRYEEGSPFNERITYPAKFVTDVALQLMKADEALGKIEELLRMNIDPALLSQSTARALSQRTKERLTRAR